MKGFRAPIGALLVGLVMALVPVGLAAHAVPGKQDTSTTKSTAQDTVKTSKFVWKKKDIPRWKGKAPYGKPYQFVIKASPKSYYLTANTPNLWVKILRANDRVVVRKFPIAYGHDDLVWQPTFGRNAELLRAWVRKASWRGEERPKQEAITLDYGY